MAKKPAKPKKPILYLVWDDVGRKTGASGSARILKVEVSTENYCQFEIEADRTKSFRRCPSILWTRTGS